MSGRYKVGWLCEALLVSRSGYYNWLRRRLAPGPRERENRVLRQQIREAFVLSRETYGSPWLAHALGRRTSRNRIARLMRRERLWARQRSKFRVSTTDSRHADPIAPNRLNTAQVNRLDQAWVTDATGILTGEGWLYLVALLDVHTRRIVGWAMSSHLDAEMAVRALQMAIQRRRPPPELIVHSDRGRQFTSAAFRAVLNDHRLTASMSRKANCYDNAHMESFWSSLKYETVYRHRYPTKAAARTALFDYIETFYNRTRLHSSLGYLSPVTFENHLQRPESP
jgi:transposase InsO family protein